MIAAPLSASYAEREARGPARASRSLIRTVAQAWLPEVLALLLVGAVLPTLVAIHYGSLNVPNSDDWAYDLSVYHLAYHGGLNLYHWGAINLVGQLVLAVPVVWLFGEHAWALAGWTSLVGTAGLVAVDYLGRQLGLTRRQALFCAVLLGAGPMWAALSTSFMTDIPSVSFMTIALAVAAGDGAADRVFTWRSCSALMIAAFAFTIRDEAGVAFAVIALCRVFRCGRPTLRRVLPWLGAVAAVGLAMGVFYLWRLSLPSGGIAYKGVPPLEKWWYGEWLFPLAGLMLTPVAILVGPLSTVRRAWRTCPLWVIPAWAAMPILPVMVYTASRAGQLGQSHSVSDMTRTLAPSFGNAYFNFYGYSVGHLYLPVALVFVLGLVSIAATIVAVASAVLGLHTLVRSGRATNESTQQPRYIATMLTLSSVGSLIIMAVVIHMQLETWDRYIFPVIMYCGILMVFADRVVRDEPRRDRLRGLLGGLSLSGLAALSVVSVIAIDGFVGSEWAYSNQFAHSVPGVSPGRIFTIWTWTSSINHQLTDPAEPDNVIRNYVPCYTLAIDRMPGSGAIDYQRGGSWVERYTYSMWANGAAAGSPGCPRSAPTR